MLHKHYYTYKWPETDWWQEVDELYDQRIQLVALSSAAACTVQSTTSRSTIHCTVVLEDETAVQTLPANINHTRTNVTVAQFTSTTRDGMVKHPARNIAARRKIPSLTTENRLQFVSACGHSSTFANDHYHSTTPISCGQWQPPLSGTPDSRKWLSNTNSDRWKPQTHLWEPLEIPHVFRTLALPTGIARWVHHDNNNNTLIKLICTSATFQTI